MKAEEKLGKEKADAIKAAYKRSSTKATREKKIKELKDRGMAKWREGRRG